MTLKYISYKQNNTNSQESFSPRIINNTDIVFSDDETALLYKGLKYNLSLKEKYWIIYLALEAETAIGHLPETERDFYRWQTAKRIEKLFKQHTRNPHYKGTKEMNVLRSIKKKLSENSVMITQSVPVPS